MEISENFFDVIENRRSIRRFQTREVEQEKVAKMLEAVRLAPSASNSQPWHVVVVRNKATIEALSKAAPAGSRFIISWMASANVVFVLALKRALTHVVAETFGNAIIRLDAGIAGEHLVLAAQAQGLGTCWIGWFNKKTVGKLVGLPDSYEVAAIIACGYPDENPSERPRKPIEEIASFERFRGKNTRFPA